jgi:hypothetical protein
VAEALPADLFATTQPAGAVDVVAAKQTAKEGQSITLKGRVGGSKEPLAANRAIMTLADLSMPTCDKSPMDQCKTPWDNCCQPAAEIVAKSVSVQVVGADGRPLKAGLSGLGGIAPMKEVMVEGVARVPAPGSLLVEARRIYVGK